MIPFLIRKRRFAECMILAWQNVEDMIDQMTIQEFELLCTPDKQDPRVDILRDNVGFQAKLRLLKDMGRLSVIDRDAINRFSDERNKLFHGGIFSNPSPLTIPENEKTRLMELAGKASQIVLNRGFGVWFDEGTGDLGNKDIPKPDTHEGVKRVEAFKRLRVPTPDREKKSGDVSVLLS